jgi:glycosyltransferase involved in cell wall biosynthesis
VRAALKPYFAGGRFDLVVCDFLLPALSIPARRDVPVVLFQHNVESEIWRRHVEVESNPLLKLLYRVEYAKMLNYERRTVAGASYVIAVSQHDRRLMSSWTPASRISVVPTGVDLEEYSPAVTTGPSTGRLMFVGSMDSKPNVDAMEYFCKEIWPLILAKVPAARFRIVGRNPPPRVRRLASASVEVTGTVPSIAEQLRQADVVVVPLRIGGGTRLKIYEAMATGNVMVSTTVGAEGLEVSDGRNILLKDGAAQFAGACVVLLQDDWLRRRIGDAAAELAKQFGWAAIGQKFSDVLEQVVASTATGGLGHE